MGKMGKSGGNIGKLVEEDGKSIQLSTKVQNFCKHIIPHFPPFSTIFPQACCSIHPPPPTHPRPTKSGFGGFPRNVVPIFQQNIR